MVCPICTKVCPISFIMNQINKYILNPIRVTENGISLINISDLAFIRSSVLIHFGWDYGIVEY